MSDPIPTTNEIREAYALNEFGEVNPYWADDFDRWLAEHDRQVKAEAWDDAYTTGVADAWTSMDYDGGATPAARVNPHRD